MAGRRHPDDLLVLTYSHNGYGVDHSRCDLKIASRLAWDPTACVLVATGSWGAPRSGLRSARHPLSRALREECRPVLGSPS